jgi:hypothetical protein
VRKSVFGIVGRQPGQWQWGHRYLSRFLRRSSRQQVRLSSLLVAWPG